MGDGEPAGNLEDLAAAGDLKQLVAAGFRDSEDFDTCQVMGSFGMADESRAESSLCVTGTAVKHSKCSTGTAAESLECDGAGLLCDGALLFRQHLVRLE